MKTKILILFLAFLVSGTISAEIIKVEIGDLYYNLDDTDYTAEVTCMNDQKAVPYQDNYPWTTVVIPSYVIYESAKYKVNRIGELAFHACDDLTSITIPNSVTSIGNDAFSECKKLTSIAIPNSVTSIGGWVFSSCTRLTSVTIPNGVKAITDYMFYFCRNLNNVAIPNSVTRIGHHAFGLCGLKSITIPSSVTTIGNLAFEDTSLESITCEAVIPPEGEPEIVYDWDQGQWKGMEQSDVFLDWYFNFTIPLYVPVNSVEAYKESGVWWKFYQNTFPIQAPRTNVTRVTVNPTDNSAIIKWPTVSGAYAYELVIEDKKGNIVFDLNFNEQGQLLSIVFNAPKRTNAPQQTQTSGFSYTVRGLDSGTTYDLTVMAKNSDGEILDSTTISFTTTGEALGIDNVDALQQNLQHKFIKDGQLLIQQGNKTFNAQGARVK